MQNGDSGDKIIPPNDDPRWVTLYEHFATKAMADYQASIIKDRIICRDIRIIRTNHSGSSPWTMSYKTIMDKEIDSRPVLLKKPERLPSLKEVRVRKNWHPIPILKRKRLLPASNQPRKPRKPKSLKKPDC